MIRSRLEYGRRTAGALALLATALAAPVQAQTGEPALLKRPADLRDAPGGGGQVLASLPQAQNITRLGERQGPWIRVRVSDQVTGWVHMFDVGPGTGPTAAAPASGGGAMLSGGIRGLTSLLRGGSAAPTVPTSTIGIRGLEAEDLARAQPNLAEVRRMEQQRQGETQAREFAADAALTPARVDPLPEPMRGAGSPNPVNGNPQQP